jgi:hypothetical protein
MHRCLSVDALGGWSLMRKRFHCRKTLFSFGQCLREETASGWPTNLESGLATNAISLGARNYSGSQWAVRLPSLVQTAQTFYCNTVCHASVVVIGRYFGRLKLTSQSAPFGVVESRHLNRHEASKSFHMAELRAPRR